MAGIVKAPPSFNPNFGAAVPSRSRTSNNGSMSQPNYSRGHSIDLQLALPTSQHLSLVNAINGAVFNALTQPQPAPFAHATTVSGTNSACNRRTGDRNVDAAVLDANLWKARVDLLKQTRLLVGGAEYEKAWHVYRDENGVDWKTLLTKTDIETNENNFIALHLLESDAAPQYGLCVRWGRIGNTCAVTIFEESDFRGAKISYKRKLSYAISGRYKIIDVIQYPITACPPIKPATICTRLSDAARSRVFDLRLEEFVRLVCKFDIEAAERCISASECCDLKGNPFGCLSPQHISAGYRALQRIDLLCSRHSVAYEHFLKANNDFYTAIPHSFDEPIILKDAKAIRQKILLLEFLGDIEGAVNEFGPLLYSFDCSIDAKFFSLNCELSLMDASCNEHMVIGNYLRNSHGPTHLFRLDVIDIFRYRNQDQVDRFVNYGNRHLLWHGSPLVNWAGIIKHGLQLRQCSQHRNMFGKGIYFADRSTKSGQYSLTGPNQYQTEAILLLCEVSLGKPFEITDACTWLSKQTLPLTYHSVKGLGQHYPNTPPASVMLLRDVVVPMGATVVSTFDTVNGHKRNYLRYNEYVVYDPCQVIMRYLVRVKVTYK